MKELEREVQILPTSSLHKAGQSLRYRQIAGFRKVTEIVGHCNRDSTSERCGGREFRTLLDDLTGTLFEAYAAPLSLRRDSEYIMSVRTLTQYVIFSLWTIFVFHSSRGSVMYLLHFLVLIYTERDVCYS